MLCFKKSYNSFGQQSSMRQLCKENRNSLDFNFIAFCDFILSWFLALFLWRRVVKPVSHVIFVEIAQRSFRESFSIRHCKNAALSLVLSVSSSEQVVTTIQELSLLNNFGIWVMHTNLSLARSWVRGYRGMSLPQLFHWLKSNCLLSTVFCVYIYMLSNRLQCFMYW